MIQTVDQSEIDGFAKSSKHWWDPEGPHAPLHKLNPTRLRYIRDQIATHFGRDPKSPHPLKDISVLDVGCGGGLLCEPLARLGAQVTGLDADGQAISVAKLHAENTSLSVLYVNDAIENMDAKKFDVLLIVEIVEHVADLPAFLKACSQRLNKNGLLIFSTLNRTQLSYYLGIIAAEKILRWVPEGTHEWEKFVTPTEMRSMLQECDLNVRNIQGMTYAPKTDSWELSDNLSINYIGVSTFT